jgi:ubiquinone/menaquinone biosynthesis C-methylase UbiE
MEWWGTRRRRRRLIGQASGRVLEVGIGTGKNLEHYPPDTELSGLDVSPKMLARASRRAQRLGRPVVLETGDVAALPHASSTFDTVVATCVFCSVADPVTGLRELARVTKPDGRILLLEHVRPRNPFLGRLADLATAVTRRLFGFRANRHTEENVVASGLHLVEVRREGVWREMIARPPMHEPR